MDYYHEHMRSWYFYWGLLLAVASARWPTLQAQEISVEEYTGTLVVDSINYLDFETQDVFMRDKNGTLHELRFGTNNSVAAPLQGGKQIRVRGIKKTALGSAGQPSRPVVQVLDMFSEEPPADSQTTSSPPPSTANAVPLPPLTDMPIIVFVVKLCNNTTPHNITGIRSALFSAPLNLGSYIRTCSYNQTQLNTNNSLVVSQVINIPCSGISASYSFNTSTCRRQDYYGWISWASNYAQNTLKINLKKYRHRVLVLPQNNPCSWVGLGNVGAWSVSFNGSYDYANAWINYNFAYMPQSYMHELGHNLYLGHATQGVCEYCDESDAMGYCCTERCFNPPHNWQLGWAQPVADLRASSLPAGVWKQYSLPAQMTNSTNFLRITTDWAGAVGANTWFASYRTSTLPYDSINSTSFSGGVNIYLYNGISTTDSTKTAQQAILKTNYATWRDGASNSQALVIQLVSITNGRANVRVCRRSQLPETMCGDGKDNDCNGYTDAADASCMARKKS